MYTVDEIKRLATTSAVQGADAKPIPGVVVQAGVWTIMCLYSKSTADSRYDQYQWYLGKNLVSEQDIRNTLDRADNVPRGGNTQWLPG